MTTGSLGSMGDQWCACLAMGSAAVQLGSAHIVLFTQSLWDQGMTCITAKPPLSPSLSDVFFFRLPAAACIAEQRQGETAQRRLSFYLMLQYQRRQRGSLAACLPADTLSELKRPTMQPQKGSLDQSQPLVWPITATEIKAYVLGRLCSVL